MHEPSLHLAELNIGRLLAPTDDPRVADFMNALDRMFCFPKSVVFCVAIVGIATGFVPQSAEADSLKQQCGGYVIDHTKSTSVIGGVARAISITNYSESDRSFYILISPPDGIPLDRASLQATLQADITCMQLDAKPIEARFVELSNDAWVFSSGCEGHWVRRESKCQ